MRIKILVGLIIKCFLTFDFTLALKFLNLLSVSLPKDFIMYYERDLINELLHPNVYMFENYMRGIKELEGVADDTLEKGNTIDAKITSLFIYYQITEEILAFVVRYSDLIIRGSLYPLRFAKKRESRVGFAKSLKMIERSIEFESKSELLDAAKQLGKLRNNIGHKMVSEYSESQFDCEAELEEVKTLFAKISDCQKKAQIWFLDEIKRIRTRKSIHILIKEYS